MITFSITVGAFLFVTVLGVGLTAALRRRELSAIDVLLAPACGFAVIVAIVVPLNRLGLAVQNFAIPLAIALVAFGFAAIVIRRRDLAEPIRACWPFGLVAAIALLIIASPMFLYGSNWFAYANDDGVNYALSAERMKMGGLYAVPSVQDFERDIRLSYYFLNAVPSERYGVDEMLAFLSTVSKMDALRSLMPLLAVLYVSGVLATAALVYRGMRGRAYAIFTSIGLAASPLLIFGADDQLLGQVAGIMFLPAAITRCCTQEVGKLNARAPIADYVLAMLASAGLFLAYPELAPFGFLSILAFHLCRQPSEMRARVTFLAIVAAGTCLLLNQYLRNVLFVIVERTSSHGNATVNPTYPFYLVPSGPATLFGILPLAAFPPEPWLSSAIAVGIAALVLALIASVRSALRQEPIGYLAVVYCATLLILFAQSSGFALFKAAMYSQPILFAASAVLIVDLVLGARGVRRVLVGALASSYILIQLVTQQAYVSASRTSIDNKAQTLAEIRNVSGGSLFDNLELLRATLPADGFVVSDSVNAVLGKIERFYTRDRSELYLPSDTSQSILTYALDERDKSPVFDHSRDQIMDRISRALDRQLVAGKFSSGVGAVPSDTFTTQALRGYRRSDLWIVGGADSPFNRTRNAGNLEVNRVPKTTPNMLAFVGSTLGNLYFTNREPIGVYASEPDFFGPNASMSGIGRYLLLEVLNPQPPFRVRLDFTETLRGDKENRLPDAAVIGAMRVRFGLSGRGSASVWSKPVTPKVIGGRSFVLIDIGEKPTRFRYSHSGLMNLWGTSIAIDPRYLSGFLRDISAMEDVPSPPSSYLRFPRDLLTSNAQYFGLYEDGWASEDFATRLDVDNSGQVVLRGQVPLVTDASFSTRVAVFVDGFRVSSHVVGVGNVEMPVLTGSGVHTVEWRFSHFQRLPGEDRRPVSMLVRSIQ